MLIWLLLVMYLGVNSRSIRGHRNRNGMIHIKYASGIVH